MPGADHVPGLKADAEYTAVLSLDLATNVQEGLVGIGGSPGESVFVKAGASTVEPLGPEDDNGYFRMNIDKGNQSNGGRSMAVLGHAAHPDVTGEEYRIKPLDNSGSPVPVAADAAGRVWLIVGTDSGFEGLSAFYYTRIACTLTPAGTPGSEGSLVGADQGQVEVRAKASQQAAGQLRVPRPRESVIPVSVLLDNRPRRGPSAVTGRKLQPKGSGLPLKTRKPRWPGASA